MIHIGVEVRNSNSEPLHQRVWNLPSQRIVKGKEYESGIEDSESITGKMNTRTLCWNVLEEHKYL